MGGSVFSDWLSAPLETTHFIALAFVAFYIAAKLQRAPKPPQPTSAVEKSESSQNSIVTMASGGSAMSAPRTDLAPPKDAKFTLDQLKAFDGSTDGSPIYVSIKGTLYNLISTLMRYASKLAYSYSITSASTNSDHHFAHSSGALFCFPPRMT